MTYLYLPGQTVRTESDAQVISNLIRKGWIELPSPPSTDSSWSGSEWISPPPETPLPNYVQFLNSIITSQIYQKALQQAITNPVVNVGFTTTMGALILAAGGNPNPDGIRTAFNMMLSAMTLEEADITELQSIVVANNMSGSVDISVLQ